MRSSEIRQREELVHAELPSHDPKLGFSNLPEPLHSYAHQVSSYYNMIGYLVMLRVVDERIAILPLHYRALKTWRLVKPYVYGERALRNNSHSFMNALEAFAMKMESMDIAALMEKAERSIRS